MRILIAGLLLAAPAVHAQQAFQGNAAVSDDVLHAIAGRADIAVIAAASQTATVAHNSVSGISTTGAIAFEDNAFQNLSGFALINANTGSNVAINSSLSVSMSLTPQ